MSTRILVTGFRPFLGETVNPSELVLKALEGETGVHTLLLPVLYHGGFEILRQHLEKETYDAVLLIGQATGADRIRLERVALNLMDAASPDEGGQTYNETPIDPEGPIAISTRMSVRALYDQLADPTKFQISNSAGAYVCNSTYYLTLKHLQAQKILTHCLFVHVPPLPEQKKVQDARGSSMDLPTTTDSILKIIKLLRR